MRTVLPQDDAQDSHYQPDRRYKRRDGLNNKELLQGLGSNCRPRTRRNCRGDCPRDAAW